MVGVSDPDVGTESFLAIPCALTAALIKVVEAMGGGDDVPGLQSSPSTPVVSPGGYDRSPAVEAPVPLLLNSHQPGEGALHCVPPAHDPLSEDSQLGSSLDLKYGFVTVPPSGAQ